MPENIHLVTSTHTCSCPCLYHSPHVWVDMTDYHVNLEESKCQKATFWVWNPGMLMYEFLWVNHSGNMSNTCSLYCTKLILTCCSAVRSVSTGRHRHQLVCCSLWFPGCQSVRNSQPPGNIRSNQTRATHVITCSLSLLWVCFVPFPCKLFESRMNEWMNE